jgi:hypothetical protein
MNIHATAITGIIAGLIAISGNIAVSYIQGKNQSELEEIKHQSSLIDKAIAADKTTTKDNLQFYLNIGLIKDKDKRIAKAIKNIEHLPTTSPPSGSIACYSHNQEGSSYSVGNDIYVMGLINHLMGRYVGRIFQPEGYEGKDISKEQQFKNFCNGTFLACKGECWAGGDTGGFYGLK